MKKRRIATYIGFVLLMLMSIGLTFSTLHSHHNLELHNSADFADTGHCLTSDITVCPICAHLVQTDVSSQDQGKTVLRHVDEVIPTDSNYNTSLLFVVNKGRSPPVIG